MDKKIFIIYFLTLIFVQNTYTKQKITFFTWVPFNEYKINQELIQEFQKIYPDIEIQYINVPSANAMRKLQIMFTAGTPPDVMSIHGAFFIQFAAKGMLLPLDDMINKSKILKISDFYPKVIEGCKYKDILYSLPRYTSVYILFYNKTLFDKEKLPYPDYTWTWKEFLDASIKLTKRNSEGLIEQYGYFIDFWGSRIYPWIWQNDGKTYDLKNNICLLNDKNTIEAIQFLVDLKFKYNVTPLALPIESKTNVEMFRVGKVGMFLSGVWEIQNLKTEKKFEWDIAPLPKNKKRATMLGMENYAISSRTKNKEISFKFLEFLLSEKQQLIMAERLDKQPSLISAGKKFIKMKKGYNTKVLIDAIEYGIIPPNLEQYNEVESILQRQLDLIWLGKTNVKDGLETATKKINAILKKKN